MQMRTKQQFTQLIRQMDMILRIRKMDKLCRKFPEVIRLKSWTEISRTYVLPKNLVRIGKPRTLSEAHQIEAKLRLTFTGAAG